MQHGKHACCSSPLVTLQIWQLHTDQVLSLCDQTSAAADTTRFQVLLQLATSLNLDKEPADRGPSLRADTLFFLYQHPEPSTQRATVLWRIEEKQTVRELKAVRADLKQDSTAVAHALVPCQDSSMTCICVMHAIQLYCVCHLAIMAKYAAKMYTFAKVQSCSTLQQQRIMQSDTL